MTEDKGIEVGKPRVQLLAESFMKELCDFICDGTGAPQVRLKIDVAAMVPLEYMDQIKEFWPKVDEIMVNASQIVETNEKAKIVRQP